MCSNNKTCTCHLGFENSGGKISVEDCSAADAFNNFSKAINEVEKLISQQERLADDMSSAIIRDFDVISAAKIVNMIKNKVASHLEQRLAESETEMKNMQESQAQQIKCNHEALDTLYGNSLHSH